MVERVETSTNGISADKSSSNLVRKSLKAAPSILKTFSGLDNKKLSHQSIQKSVNMIVSDKSNTTIQTGDRSQILEIKKPSYESSSSIRSNKQSDDDENKNKENATDDQEETLPKENTISMTDFKFGKPFSTKMRPTKFMKKYPELFRDDVSINPSYTGLKNFPYNVVCRQRFSKNKQKINRRLRKEIENITMMQSLALDGVRVGRIFTVGFPNSATIVPDFATPNERLHLNRMLSER